jgi:short-subunit dehydrogenase
MGGIDMQIRDKVFVVTGGGSGIGRSVVLNLLTKGSRVAALDLNEESLNALMEYVGTKKEYISIHTANVTDLSRIQMLPEEIIEKHQQIDGIIHCAGIIQPFIDINDLDYQKIRMVMEVNFFGTIHMVKTFLPYLLKRPEAHILNVSSMGGFLPVPGQSVYGASKAAVKLLTEALYAELKDTHVGVTVVFPGGVATDITKNSGVEAPKMPENGKAYHLLQPQEAAEIIVHAIIKNKYQVYAGKDSKFMNFLYRLSPKKAVGIIAKNMKSIRK